MNIRRRLNRTLLQRYKSHKQKSCNTTLDHCLHVIQQTTERTKYAFLISHSHSNSADTSWPNARLVEPLFDPETFTFWIGTNPHLRKVAEIKANPHVTLAFGNEREDANVIIQGTATLVTDTNQRRQQWKGTWRLFFPNGPASDDYILIKIIPQKIELMSFKRNVVPEPFGLKPVKLHKENNKWTMHA